MAASIPESKIQNAEVRYRNQMSRRGLAGTIEEKKQDRRQRPKEVIQTEEDAQGAYSIHKRKLGVPSAIQPKGLVGKTLLRSLSPFFWLGMSVAVTLYFVQLLFALISILIFAGGTGIENIFFVGDILKKFTNFTSNATGVGLGFWGIATIINCATFAVYALLFRIRKISILESTTTLFVSIIALSLSMLPLLNLWPWILLWIIYMNTIKLFR